ncbi:hypothetical protein Belba_2982 [Belliella baltica DSM 15883]|uniref:Uncharacterized protein n=1 Tax=Belliella baltica (strain DSM 15883 / CIP 108006 / LMG 21964 / BA134) TaxID=866536 RepID=I3Z8D6_BELBD|nr:hypothetical protein [Belliella baltica]AFL85504.1 hypothetical protein Belba_2982 [Belliella baltica DSM 15883]
MKQIDEKMENILQVAQLFEVEELEERVEFGKWSAETKGGYSEEKGGYIEGGVKYTF